MAIDKHLVNELILFIENDYPLYKKSQDYLESLKLKKKKGTFEQVKAKKGIVTVLIAPAITKYKKSFGLPPVSASEKSAIANEIFKGYWNDEGLKNVRKATKRKPIRKKK